MSLRSFLEDVGSPDHALAVVGDAAEPLKGMLAETFAETPVEVESSESAAALDLDRDLGLESGSGSPPADDTVVVLLEDGTPVAASAMDELYDSLLAINSDLFTTGARGLGEIELPDVLANLADTRLRLRGYPLAHNEKLVLVLLSRYIEQRAWRADSGTLRAAFQHLSRLDDEIGTLEVYAELERAAVDVHVYGTPDESGVTDELDVTIHTGTGEEYRNGWFVVYDPADPATDPDPAALLCLETEPRIWDGFWTFDPERVAALEAYAATEL
ncbi:DICT sensory domain-containing protein [Halopiger thermotolerans]